MDFNNENITDLLQTHSYFKAYGGANGNKVAMKINDKIYMVKFPPTAKTTAINSYTNGTISEYVSCRIIETLGLDVQKTFLSKVDLGDKEKLVVVCEDFEIDDWSLFEFAMIKNSCINSDTGGYNTELEDVLNSIHEQTFMPSDELEEYFWSLFFVDTLLGDFDRHNGNWGLLVNNQKGIVAPSPIYDCGSCLYPQLDDLTMEQYLNDMEEIDKRVFVFPQSALKINGKKINYYDFLMSTDNQCCLEVFENLYQQIDMELIYQVIEETPYISDVRKQFYQTMVSNRYEKIIEPVHEKIIEIQEINKGMCL